MLEDKGIIRSGAETSSVKVVSSQHIVCVWLKDTAHHASGVPDVSFSTVESLVSDPNGTETEVGAEKKSVIRRSKNTYYIGRKELVKRKMVTF